MFHFISKSTIIQLLISILLLIFTAYRIFFSSIFFIHQNYFPLSASFNDFIESYPILSKALFFVLLIVQIILLIHYIQRNNYFDSFTLLPAIWYLALLNCGNIISYITPIVLVNLVSIVLLLVNSNYQNKNIKTRVFFSGLFIGLISLFDFSAILLIVFVIGSLVVNRFDKMKDILIALSGIFTTYLYFFCYFFFTNQLDKLYTVIQWNHFFSFYDSLSHYSFQLILFVLVFIVVTIFVIAKLKLFFDNRLIILRKRYITLNLLFVVLLLIFLASSIPFKYSFFYLIPIFSIYFSLLNHLTKSYLINDLMIIIFIVVLCL